MAENSPKDLKAINTAIDALLQDFDQIKAAPEYEPFKAGEYVCRVADCSMGVAETGRSGLKVVFNVKIGQYAGRNLYLDRYLPLPDQSELTKEEKEIEVQMAQYLKRDLILLGLDLKQLKKLPSIEGIFLVTVEIQKGKPRVMKFSPTVDEAGFDVVA